MGFGELELSELPKTFNELKIVVSGSAREHKLGHQDGLSCDGSCFSLKKV